MSCDPCGAKSVCIGNALEELNITINKYSTLEAIFTKTYNDMSSLKTTLAGLPSSNALSQTNKDLYKQILTNTRAGVAYNTSVKTNLNNLAIPKCRIAVTYGCGYKKLCYDLEGLTSLFYVQKTNNVGALLYFQNDPRTVPYASNPQVTSVTEYPVWYYTFGSTTSDNYTLAGSNYDDVLNLRTLDKYNTEYAEKKTLDALGKYLFTYKKETCEIIQKDPENPIDDIDPFEQGVTNGIYAMADCIAYATNGQGLLAVENAIEVLFKLISGIHEYICELDSVKERLCSLC